MSNPIMPLSSYILAVLPEAKKKTDSGLFLPEAAQQVEKIATVLAIGPDVKQIKKNDSILYQSFSITEVEVDKTPYILIKEEEVLAKIKS